MFIRALSIALWCASAYALTPLSAAADDNECALYLSGPGRTSSYDYSLNLLKGNFGYEGQHTCITYDAVNQAYLEARNRIVVSQPKGDWKAEDFASVGELMLDISINLARTYGLTYEEIEKGLPLIDTSRTLIREVCPPVFSHVECRAGKYRRLDGLCNNLEHPTWGATMAPFQRLIGPLFADGINAPRISHTGRDLPLSRVVSRTMHPDEGFHDHAGTVMVIAWGQFMDHDYTLTGTPLDPINRNDPEECCKRPPHLKHPYCNEIRVPEDDYFYRLFGVKCIDFVRGFPSPRPGCRLGSRVPFNTLTGTIDGNTVYGVTEKFARKLRTGYGGLLRMNPVFKEYGLRDLLPLKLDIPDEGCTRPNKNMYCFEAGEIRVNEQLVLTVMHTLMAREHNRVANALAEVNPHWDDETLFQEARRINIAEIQHITYNEFLPILLGKDVMEKFGLVLEKEGYWDGYDPEVNPDVLDSFAAAAYRFGHSLLPTAVERWSKAHKFIASKRLSDLIRRPYDLYRAGVLDEYVMGLMNQVAQAMDDSITQEVTNHLFKKVGARFGMDLVSFNMQRGREFGLPGYMEFRKFCGLPGAESFQDLFGTMSNETVRKYESIFEHPIDVDLWSGGVSERPLPGSMLGPTFACIIATQFSYSRRGDRFWFELNNQPSTFTPEQLKEIRKSRLARVICDNTDIIDTVQLYPMVLPDHELNPRVPCRSGIIPSMDFTKWAEPAPFHGAKQFITEAYALNNNSNCEESEIAPTFGKAANETKAILSSIVNSTNCESLGELKSEQQTNLVTLPISFNQTNNNNESKTLNNNVNCSQSFDGVSSGCQDKIQISNDVPDSDTVLKYVYKPNDKRDTIEKSKPHPLNSLRKKRSVDIVNKSDNITVDESKNSPLIVNYETLHSPDESTNQRITGESIQNSALANFNIQTSHEPNSPADKNNQFEKTSPYQSNEEKNDNENHDENDARENYSRSKESAEDGHSSSAEDDKKSEYRNNDRSREANDSNSSGETDDSSENNESNEREKYRKHDEAITHRNSNKPEDDGRSGYYRSDKPPRSGESHESNERFTDQGREKSSENDRENSKSVEHDKLPYKDNNESVEKQDFKKAKQTYNDESNEKVYSNEKQKNSEDTKPVEEESYEDDKVFKPKQNNKPRKEFNNDSDSLSKTTPASFQDVDLGDFSFERIQLNDKGKIVPVDNENIGADHLDERDQEIKTHSNQKEISSAENSDETLKDVKHENQNEPVHINDGEIKPVVEINNENNDSNEEHSNEDFKPNFEENKSLEILGTVDKNSNQLNDRIVARNNEDEKDDVKQQFERIPTNYNHDLKNQNKDKNNEEVQNKESTADTEGTLDTFTPNHENYDEKLRFKFDDIHLSLPEIKLPKDILSYAYEGPAYEKENYKQKQYHSKDKSGEKSTDKDDEDNDDDNYRGYYGYYGNKSNKQDYVKKDNEDKNDDDSDENSEKENDDEDLYEKFVRERFGKKGSFLKRSENLQNARITPKDEKLYDTVKNILKQTHETQKQAEKSGDPKAGYMWTLEYGEVL